MAKARLARVAPGGRVLEELSTGDQGVFACTLVGPERRTLFLCVAPDFFEHQRKGTEETAIWTLPVAVPGPVDLAIRIPAMSMSEFTFITPLLLV